MRFLTLVLLATIVSAAPDPAKIWKAELKKLEKKERHFWDGIQKRIGTAEETLWHERWTAEANRDPDATPNPVVNYSDFNNLYGDLVTIQESMGAQDLKFAESKHPKALVTLFKTLLDIAAAIDKTEAELVKATPSKRGVVDQRITIRRHALATREWRLVQALAKCENAVDFLAAGGFKQAAKKDGRRSFARRVAVIDALGLTGDENAINPLASFAQAAASEIRIAALEALLPFGAKGRPAIEPLLDDGDIDVRRALLQGIVAFAGEEPGWIAPVLRHLRDAKGQLRLDHILTLEALTNQRFGDDADAWQEWFDDYSKEIAGGGFKETEIEIREVKRKAAPAACTLYGVASPSRSIAFVFDGSRRMWWPADWDVQKTKYKYNWDRRRNQWKDQHENHQTVLLREFGRTTAGMAADTRFGILTFAGPFKTYQLGDKRLLTAGKRDFRLATKLIDDMPGDGWCSPQAALRAACAMDVDTVFLVASGDPVGGRFIGPDPAFAAFKRIYRFRRVVVNALRICEDGKGSETYMQGLAKLTGGTYVWLKKPPTAN